MEETNNESLIIETINVESRLDLNGNILDPYGFNINLKTSTDQIINISEPEEYYYDRFYAYAKCDIITTFWVKHIGFSYLNNPVNTPDNFFLFLEDEGLAINNWNEKLTNNKISSQTMINFVEQFNNQINYAKEINHKKLNLLKRTKLIYIFAISFLVVSLIFLVFLVIQCFMFDINEFFVLLIGFLISFFGFIVLLFLNLKRQKKTEYILNMFIYLNYTSIDKFINKWNNENFLPNGIYVLVTINLKYVQFVLDKNIRFCLSNHKFPLSIKRNSF